MAEVLVRYTAKVYGENGEENQAQACGGVADDGLWEGWIEFISGDRALRTARETEQPNRDALMYWAEGLTIAYLEGAFARATSPRREAPVDVVVSPRFDRPAPPPASRAIRPSRAILDPFSTFEQGEDLLRSQLNALSHDNLIAIVDAYALPVKRTADVSSRRLADAIVDAVRASGASRSRPVGETEVNVSDESRP